MTKNYDAVDLAKFILSIVVCGIHTLGKYGIYPFFRIAVPVFFIISSFFFFKKIKNCNKEQGSNLLKRFIIRNVKLYLFWFVLLFPITAVNVGLFKGNFIFKTIKLLMNIIFGSTFVASWYISALVIGVVFVFFLKRFLNINIIITLTFILYVFCCLFSNYRGLMNEKGLIFKLLLVYPGTIYNSFPVGLFWIAVGALIAEKYNDKSVKIPLLTSLFAVSVLLLVGEYYLVKKLGCSIDNDCYFMLIPVCILLFLLLLNINVSIKNAVLLRNFSTIIYCAHGSILTIISLLFLKFENLTFYQAIVKFFVTLLLSICLSFILLFFSRKKKFKWVKSFY